MKKIYVSYDYDNDKHFKNLLTAWSANSMFEKFEFIDVSADISINSNDPTVIKRVISAKINTSSHFLVIVGSKTHKSSWVEWEIDKAVDLEKRIIAVKTDRFNQSPDVLLGVGASWAMSFTYEEIIKAIKGN